MSFHRPDFFLIKHGAVRIKGRLPAALRDDAVCAVARLGKRIECVDIDSDGNYTARFHSHKRIFFILLCARAASGELTPFRRILFVNLHPSPERDIHQETRDALDRYRFTGIKEQPADRPPPAAARPLDIHWIIPDFTAGHGGHTNIFRLAAFLKGKGHRQTFWVAGGTRHENPSAYIDTHFMPLGCPVNTLTARNLEAVRGDVVVATDCWSAYYARGIRNVWRKAYLVQDYEPFFFPLGYEYHAARLTYRFGFRAIAGGRWLQEMLRRDGDPHAARFDFAYDPVHYHLPLARREGGPVRIAFYARISTERRTVLLGLKALEQLALCRQDFVVHFFGQNIGEENRPYACVNEGVLTHANLGRLYRECDLGLVLSATNHSLIPTEMMACGLPVIELEGENNSMIYPDGSIALTPPDECSLAEIIARLMDSPSDRDALRYPRLAHARGLSWEAAGLALEEALLPDSAST